MKKVITFGEIMLRLAPQGYLRFVQADTMQSTYGGGEANVAVSLANYGFDVGFVSKVPRHEIGQAAVNSLRKYGVGTEHMVRGGERLGIYYLEKGASQRASKVIYDRAGSAIADAQRMEFDWNEILKDAAWFHTTGITPAVSENLAEITLEAVKVAKKLDIKVSLDLNYRKKLWSKERAKQVMSEICKYVDVLIANEEDALDVFGIGASNTDVSSGTVNHEGYVEVARRLVSQFGFETVAITLRESISANRNLWSALLYTDMKDGSKNTDNTKNEDKAAFFSNKYDLNIVDRVGGGDSFGGGLICASLDGLAPQESIEFAVAASALKHSVEGDFNLVSREEVLALALGDASGRVKR